MKQIFKLYKHHLRKLLTSWYFWTFLVFDFFFVFGLPYFEYSWQKSHSLGFTYKQYLKERFALIGGRRIFDEEGMTSRGGNRYGLFHCVGDFFELSATSKFTDIFATSWQFFCLGMLGIGFSSFFLSNAVSSLISKPISDGEDKTTLNVASPIKRDDLVISKVVAFFTVFWLTSLLTFTLPYLFYYTYILGFNAKVISIFLVTSLLLFSLLFFSLFLVPFLLLDFVASWLKTILSIFLGISPYVWAAIRNAYIDKKLVIETGKIFGQNFFVIVPLALLIGGLSFLAYRQLFRKKDFS